MGNIFNLENRFWTFMGHVADLIILNVLFIICCIPIVTIGPSITALYYVTLKIIRGEESYMVKGFFKSFRENFRQGIVIWLILLAIILLLVVDFLIMQNLPEGISIPAVIRYGLGILALILAMETLYVFPLLAKFSNTIKATIKNALIMSVAHLPMTLVMLAISVLPLILMAYGPAEVFSYGILAFIMLGFSGIALAHSFFLVKIFDKYIPKEESEEENDEEYEEESEHEEYAEIPENENQITQ